MGGRETGGLCSLLPGYRTVTDAEHRAEMRRLWGIPPELPGIPPAPGLASTELVEALEDGRVKAVWVVATNPVVSQPDAQRFAAALRRADLVIAQDAYHPTETSNLAHVVLPAAQWPEKTGTMTNSERRVGLVRAAIAPPGDALPDWEIFARIARALGYRDAFAWSSAAEVFAEHVTTTAGRLCDQTGLSHARLARTGPLQWPIPARGPEGDDHDGTERLYGSQRFPTPTGRARFGPTPHSAPADAPDPDFPLVLNTGRVAHQWHTMTRTAKAADLLAAEPEPFLEIHPDDAQRAGVRDGERVEVRSRRGRARLVARITENVTPGSVFAPFHWGAIHLEPGAGAVNAVTARALDPVSRQPELKACAVRLEPVRVPRRQSRRHASRRLLVVGTGMSAMATVEALLAHEGGDDWDVTMVGAEPAAPYNRVLLSQLLAGATSEAALELQPAAWLEGRGITVLSGRTVRGLSIDTREAELDDGERLAFDRLVLATGSRPVVPPIAGVELEGVHVFRTLADARAILEQTASARRAVVIGGGLLGLEAARGLRERGLQVTVLHLAGWLMEQQLDGIAGGLLARAMAGLGIETRLAASAEVLLGSDGRVATVALADGTEVPADMVVLATGVRPDVDLARSAGVEVDRGIVVDDELRTSAPGVHAVGECAQHRGVVYGLWAPLLEMAKVAGAALAGAPAAFRGVVPATTLKVAGVQLFCCGRTIAEREDEELLALDSRDGRYRKLVLRDGRLAGAILLGDLTEARALRALLSSQAEVPEETIAAHVRADPAATPAPPEDPRATVCSCMNISRGALDEAIRSRDLRTVAEVARHTRASTGCGGCRPEVAAIVDAHWAQAAEPLPA
jgi:ferredoxin-nitrate reductase